MPDHVSMSVSDVVAHRPVATALHVAVGVLLSVVLLYATDVLAHAWLSTETVVDGAPVAVLVGAGVLAAFCTFVGRARPVVGLAAGVALVAFVVVGRLTWTPMPFDFDPWSFDVGSMVAFGSAQLLTSAAAAVLVVSSLLALSGRRV
jgi:hypothetical protein